MFEAWNVAKGRKVQGGRILSQGTVLGSRVTQWSKALHLSARGVTTVPGSNPGYITSGRDWESHRAAHN